MQIHTQLSVCADISHCMQIFTALSACLSLLRTCTQVYTPPSHMHQIGCAEPSIQNKHSCESLLHVQSAQQLVHACTQQRAQKYAPARNQQRAQKCAPARTQQCAQKYAPACTQQCAQQHPPSVPSSNTESLLLQIIITVL